MTERIVNRFKAIQINKQQGNFTFIGLHALNAVNQLVVKIITVEKFGQWIACGQELNMLLRQRMVGNINQQPFKAIRLLCIKQHLATVHNPF